MAGSEAKTRLREMLSALAGEGGDLGYMDDALPVLTAVLAEVAAPDFECVMVPVAPTAPLRFPGVEGIVEAWRDYGGAIERVRARLEEVRESDDHIVLLVDQIATTAHQAVEISQPSAMVVGFEGDRVRTLEFHLDRSAALRAAGLAA